MRNSWNVLTISQFREKVKMKHFASLVYLFAVALSAIAQPYGDAKFKQKFNKADALVYDGSYMEALPLLEEMYASDSMNANLNHLLGIAYLMGKKDHDLAIKRLESATRDVASPGNYAEGDWKEKKAPGITYYYLGKAYHFKNRFDRAVTNYYNYRSFIDLDDVETYNQVRQQIQYAENAMDLVKNPVGVQITNLGPEINTRFPEYCPIVSADGKVLIFTSRREGGTGGVVDDQGNYYEDIYACQLQPNGKWTKPQSIGSNINSAGHEAAIGLSPDGQLLFIYKDDNNNGNIYYSTLEGTEWSKPQPMGSDINTTSWETHASVNATQDFLVFVSNRVGGYGGRDLWYCKRLPNGEWGLAQNMGSVVNTDFEEDSPFISADGKTLIFSSMGHTSMGGFDIFRSELEDGVWTRPENIGYPINTSEDDVFFILTPDGRTAYYSSRKDGGFGETDLYKLKLEVKKADLVAVARGVMKVPAMDYADIKAKITVTDEGGAEIGTYRPSRSTGVYVIVLSPGETYTITYHADGYPEVVTKLPIGSGDVYADYEGPVELEEVVFGENILALQKEKERLEKEAADAAVKAEQEKQLAAEAEAKAKEDAERLAIERTQEEEKRKAENAAAKETADAEQALREQQEQVRKAEVERKMAESKARYVEEQEAKRLANEKAKRDAEEAEQRNAEELVATEDAQLAEESDARKASEAKEAEDRRLAQEAAIKESEQEKERADQLAEAAAKEQAELKAKQEEEQRLAEETALKQQQIEKEKEAQLAASEEARQQQELKAKQEAEDRKLAEAAAKEATERAKQEEEQRQLAEAKRAEEEAEARKLEEARIAAEQKAEADRMMAAEQDRKAREQADAESATVKAEEARLAAAEQKRQDLQKRIDELKQQQEVQKEHVQNEEPKEVKEVAVSNSDEGASQAVSTDEIKAKREAMLAKIEQLKKQKEQVGQQKVKDEFAVAEASELEKSAQKKKEALVKESEKKTQEIERLQKELVVVETQVVQADAEVKKAREEYNVAQEKLASDIEKEKQLEAEAKQKAEEAVEAERQIKELEEQERKRLEAERFEREKFEREQREEAERTQRELMQLEALAEQQRQVEAAIKLEEEKKRKMDLAEKEAFTQKEKLANAETLQELRDLNRQLIEENRDLKLQLADINRKLDLILAKLDYTPDPNKVDMSNATMQTLQEGKRLILRNIFFDYNEATLRPKSKYELNDLYTFLKENPSVKIVVSGHTDSRGNDSYNLRLSKDRAQAVVDYLVRNGIASNRLAAVGYGETRPIARNENADGSDNPVGRQLNRRIEISLPEGKVKGVEVEEISVPKDARLNR